MDRSLFIVGGWGGGEDFGCVTIKFTPTSSIPHDSHLLLYRSPFNTLLAMTDPPPFPLKAMRYLLKNLLLPSPSDKESLTQRNTNLEVSYYDANFELTNRSPGHFLHHRKIFHIRA